MALHARGKGGARQASHARLLHMPAECPHSSPAHTRKGASPHTCSFFVGAAGGAHSGSKARAKCNPTDMVVPWASQAHEGGGGVVGL